jgi:hypothetical protein
MRKTILAMFLALLTAAFAYGVQSGWMTFSAPDARFSVLLPKEPTLQVVSHPENAKLTHNRYSDTEAGYAFVIEYFDDVVNLPPEKYLDEVRDGVIATLKGTLIREEHIKLGENAGREIEYSLTAQNGNPFIGRTRIFVVGPALYSLSFVQQRDLDKVLTADAAQKYFSSFKLTPAK